MRGSISSGSASGSATRRWLACGTVLLAAAACVGPLGPAGIPHDCASEEAVEALLASDLEDRLVSEWLLERADCRAHNLVMLR